MTDNYDGDDSNDDHDDETSNAMCGTTAGPTQHSTRCPASDYRNMQWLSAPHPAVPIDPKCQSMITKLLISIQVTFLTTKVLFSQTTAGSESESQECLLSDVDAAALCTTFS